jgi:hypothetical protein
MSTKAYSLVFFHQPNSKTSSRGPLSEVTIENTKVACGIKCGRAITPKDQGNLENLRIIKYTYTDLHIT